MNEFMTALERDISNIDFMQFLSASAIGSSLFLIAVVLFIRRILIRYVRKDAEILAKEQRRWIIRIKNTSVTLIVIGLVLIWAPQLHTFALSIAAFAVALVVATKEMIMCLTGGIMRATSQPFKVGEWVTVDGVTGEVIDFDAFAFQLQEVDMEGKTYQFTGRTITVPNSKLFTSNVENANFFKAYIFEDVRVAVQFTDIDAAEAFDLFKEICEKHFDPQRKEALSFHRKIRRRAGVDVGSPEPVYDLTTSELGHYQLHCRLFVQTSTATNMGSDITREFLSRIHKLRLDAKEAATQKEAEEQAAAEDADNIKP